MLPLCSVRSSMHPVGNPLWLAVAAAAALAFAAAVRAAPAPNQPEFYDPRIRGGEMLNNGVHPSTLIVYYSRLMQTMQRVDTAASPST